MRRGQLVSTILVSSALIASIPIQLGNARAQNAPATGSNDGGPLAKVVAAAFASGFGRPLSASLCGALGITANKELPVEQLSAVSGNVGRSFNASRHRGFLDIVMSRRTPDDLLVFLVSAQGVLVKTIEVKGATPMREMPVEAAAAEFEKEKAWWLDTWSRQGASGAASRPPAK